MDERSATEDKIAPDTLLGDADDGIGAIVGNAEASPESGVLDVERDVGSGRVPTSELDAVVATIDIELPEGVVGGVVAMKLDV